jgi:hypothetical protein
MWQNSDDEGKEEQSKERALKKKSYSQIGV